MITATYLVHALSPLHSGTGHSADLIDLPIARMKATGIPYVPGSSIKGVLRGSRTSFGSGSGDPRVQAVFGPDTSNAREHAGALVVGDARLLALPVRSFRGTFAWVSSPLLLTLAARDLGSKAPRVPRLASPGALATRKSICTHNNTVLLEDLDLPVQHAAEVEEWAQRLAARVSPGTDIFSGRFVIVDDDTMTFLWETATQIDARVRLDPETRTVADGALWLEESLPPETVLIGLLAAEHSRKSETPMTPEEVLDFALPADAERVLQLGGKATIGRGRCRLVRLRA